MTKEDKALLIKDLSARLPYAVTVEHTNTGMRGTLRDLVVYPTYNEDDTVKDFICTTNFFGDGDYFYIEYFKPYLFPLSSMTEEQKKEYHELIGGMFGTSALINFEVLEDFFRKNHFDYRGLIEKGLALDATGKNIY